MKQVSRKEILQKVEVAIGNVLKKLKISSTSKKTEKLIEKVSRKISGHLKDEIRKQRSKMSKAAKVSKQPKKIKVKAKKTDPV